MLQEMVHVTQVLNAKIREAPKVEIVQQGKLNFFIIKGLKYTWYIGSLKMILEFHGETDKIH